MPTVGQSNDSNYSSAENQVNALHDSLHETGQEPKPLDQAPDSQGFIESSSQEHTGRVQQTIYDTTHEPAVKITNVEPTPPFYGSESQSNNSEDHAEVISRHQQQINETILETTTKEPKAGQELEEEDDVQTALPLEPKDSLQPEIQENLHESGVSIPKSELLSLHYGLEPENKNSEDEVANEHQKIINETILETTAKESTAGQEQEEEDDVQKPLPLEHKDGLQQEIHETLQFTEDLISKAELLSLQYGSESQNNNSEAHIATSKHEVVNGQLINEIIRGPIAKEPKAGQEQEKENDKQILLPMEVPEQEWNKVLQRTVHYKSGIMDSGRQFTKPIDIEAQIEKDHQTEDTYQSPYYHSESPYHRSSIESSSREHTDELQEEINESLQEHGVEGQKFNETIFEPKAKEMMAGQEQEIEDANQVQLPYGSKSIYKISRDSLEPPSQEQYNEVQRAIHETIHEPIEKVEKIVLDQHPGNDYKSPSESQHNKSQDAIESSSQEHKDGLQQELHETFLESAGNTGLPSPHYGSESQFNNLEDHIETTKPESVQKLINETILDARAKELRAGQEQETEDDVKIPLSHETLTQYNNSHDPLEAASQERNNELQQVIQETISDPMDNVGKIEQEHHKDDANQSPLYNYSESQYNSTRVPIRSSSQEHTDGLQQEPTKSGNPSPHYGSESQYNNSEVHSDTPLKQPIILEKIAKDDFQIPLNHGYQTPSKNPEDSFTTQPKEQTNEFQYPINETIREEQHPRHDYHTTPHYGIECQTKNIETPIRSKPDEHPNDHQQTIYDVNYGPRIIMPDIINDIDLLSDKSQCPMGYQSSSANQKECLNCAEPQTIEDESPAQTVDANLNRFCLHRHSGTYVHPNDCSKYLMCDFGRTFEFQCDSGTYFNELWLTCDHRANVVCNKQPAGDDKSSRGIVCPNGIHGNFAHPFSRGHYINCSNAQTLVETCPKGTYFSISKLFCTPQCDMWSNELSEEYPKLTCPTSVANGRYLYPFDASKYIHCAYEQKVQILACPPQHFYSISKKICLLRHVISQFDRVFSFHEMLPIDYSATMMMLSNQRYKIECPPDVFGVFPYPFDNDHYLKCINGRLLIKPCRRGFVFSLSQRICQRSELLETLDTVVPQRLSGIQKKSSDDDEYSIGIVKLMNSTVLKCPHGVSGTFIYPFLNTRYVKCINGVMMVETCPHDEVFTIGSKKCMLRDHVDVKDVVQGVEGSLRTISNDHTLGVICGPQANGRYAHPEDMRKVVICRNGIVTIEKLPADQIFDLSSKT